MDDLKLSMTTRNLQSSMPVPHTQSYYMLYHGVCMCVCNDFLANDSTRQSNHTASDTIMVITLNNIPHFSRSSSCLPTNHYSPDSSRDNWKLLKKTYLSFTARDCHRKCLWCVHCLLVLLLEYQFVIENFTRSKTRKRSIDLKTQLQQLLKKFHRYLQ